MLVYEGIKSSFIGDVDLNKIADKIHDKFQEAFKKKTTISEYNSWKQSMYRMRGVLADDGIPDNAGVAIEFNIPHTSNRIDFLLSGYNDKGENSIMIIELKQWSEAKAVEGKDGIVTTFLGGGIRETTHPSYQAYSYASLINHFNQDVYEKNVNLHPCAFLHNYELNNEDPIYADQYQVYIEKAPLFGSEDFEKLRTFIKKFIVEGDEKEGLYIIENGKIKPSKMLQDSFTSVLKGNEEFVLIDSQKIIFEEALRIGINSNLNSEKQVLIVDGGPGTGKSVLAINLLQQFLSRSMNTFYVTKNSAPREVFKSMLKIDKLSGMNNLFKGSGQFIDTEANYFDVLIVDESHRLNEKSGLFANLGENQIKEIINASKFSIFFIDENQKVTLKDIGSVDEIEKYAKHYNAGITKMELSSQFRCDGSDGYLAWLDNVLEIRETANYEMEHNYDFKVFDNPNDLRQAIEERNKVNNKSRLVAGYCWNWINDGNSKNSSDIHDIVIPEHNFSMSWNLGNTSTYAIDESSINEIGCIHTVQGLEFDYVGVIIGKDLRYENNKIITDYNERARTDQSLKGIKKYAKEIGEEAAQKLAESIIKNTYKTLMTRGMKGCYIYCEDENLNSYFQKLI
ncbi:MAG: DUF2075 domain-containing protein [Tenericutes bacterium]|nr:DUF2075 domain-containing protein [Mycoplasmatota bacterium]